MSFAFTVRADEYDYDSDTRIITDIDRLYDVSVVDLPWYDTTSVYARGLDNSNDFMEKRNKLREEREEQIKNDSELASLKEEILNKLG